MIKRQMHVAVTEEDYGRAAELRDSHVMIMYSEIQKLRERGFPAEAKKLADCLDAETSIWSFEEESH
jgi:UvrB/uvrC motif